MFSRVSLLAPAVGVALLLGSAVPAEAATPSIKPIKAATADYQKSVRIKPSYTVPSGVVVSKARLTVKKGSRTVARNASSAALKAGTYRVTQTLTYRTFTTKSRSVVVVPRGSRIESEAWMYEDQAPFIESCTYTRVDSAASTLTVNCPVYRMTADFDQVRLGSFNFSGSYVEDGSGMYHVTVAGDVAGDYSEPAVGGTIDLESIVAPSALSVSQRYRAYSGFRTKQATHTLRVKQRPKPRGCSKPADFRKVHNGMSVAQVRRVMQNGGKVTYSSGGYVLRQYKTCDKYDYMSVSFEGGYVYDKTIMDF